MFQLLQAYVRVSRVRTRSGIVLSANELVNVAMTCRVSECSDRPVVVLPKCLLCQSVVVFRTVATSKSSATRECNTHWTRRSIPSWARGPTDSERYVRNHPPHQPTNQPTNPTQPTTDPPINDTQRPHPPNGDCNRTHHRSVRTTTRHSDTSACATRESSHPGVRASARSRWTS